MDFFQAINESFKIRNTVIRDKMNINNSLSSMNSEIGNDI